MLQTSTLLFLKVDLNLGARVHCCIAVACNIAALEIYCKKQLVLVQLGVCREVNVLFYCLVPFVLCASRVTRVRACFLWIWCDRFLARGLGKNVVSFMKAIDHHLGCRSARCTWQSNAVVLAVNECSMWVFWLLVSKVWHDKCLYVCVRLARLCYYNPFNTCARDKIMHLLASLL